MKTKTLWRAAALASLLVSPPVHAQPSGTFPATGQTTSYPSDKNDHITGAVAVPDDGAIQAGATLSFTDNGDGTITDNNTGLLWEKKSDDGGLHDKDTSYPWSGNGSVDTIWDWLDRVNAEGGTGFAGYHDWRIPNAKELQSLVDYESASPMISAAFKSGCAANVTVLSGSCTAATVYWTSTTWSTSTSSGWGVTFGDGYLNVFSKASAYRVRAVRGGLSGPVLPVTGQTTAYKADKNDGIAGTVAVPDDGTVQAGAPFSFTDNGDGTVTDNTTGLMWEKKSNDFGLHDERKNFYWSGNGGTETIWDWLDDVNAEIFAGHQDWRIPNAKELLSIANFQGTVPSAFNNNCVSGATVITGSCTLSQGYWTSTSQASSTVGGSNICGWYVSTGSVYPDFKSNTRYVRAVRGGTP